MPMPGLQGSLLVAAPTLVDPIFARSVVLMAGDDDDGAYGVILNRPTSIEVGDVLPGWVENLTEPAVVHIGGPVQADTAVGVGRLRRGLRPPGWTPIFDDVGLVDLDVAPADTAGFIGELRVFAGYSGWGARQLHAELDGPDWFVVAAEESDPFMADAVGLWKSVLQRQRGHLALFANYPPSPDAELSRDRRWLGRFALGWTHI